MVRTYLIFLLLMFASLVNSDSDSTGVFADTTERIIISVSNSTGLFESRANCSIRVWNPDGSVNLGYSNMGSLGDGRFDYNWTVPQTIGNYQFLFNCTTMNKENLTKASTLYVVPRSFEKAVAHGRVKYIPWYEEVIPEAKKDVISLWVVIGVLLILGGAFYAGSKLGYSRKL